jgi:hypothetical protein
MKKYQTEFKLEVVKSFLAGVGPGHAFFGRVALVHHEGVDVQRHGRILKAPKSMGAPFIRRPSTARLIRSASSLQLMPMASNRWSKVTLDGTARRPSA